MTFLLMVFLAGVCLFEAYPPAPWGGPPWLAAALTGAALLVVAGHAAYLSWAVRRRIAADPTRLDRHLATYDRARGWHGALNLVLYLIALGLFGWGRLVRGDDDHTPGFGTEMLLLAPFLVGQLLSWVFFYDGDKAAHVASHRSLDGTPFAPGLEAGRPAVPPFGGRWSHVAFQLRQKLALVFIPVLLLVGRQEVTRLLPPAVARGGGLLYVMTFVSLASVFLVLPLLIRLVLGLRPLPDGPLRERLVATARRLGFRLSDILVWDTRQGMANAMIVGLVPWLRYVVLTDRMLEEFSPEEIQAVFGHELGHVKHQHMLFYLLFLATSMTTLALLAEYYLLPGLASVGEALAEQFPGVVPAKLGEWLLPTGALALFPLLTMILAYIYLMFGFISRRCERQADVFGCRAVSCGDPNCQGHGPETAYDPAGALCPAGIRTFTRSLDKVALVNGLDRERPGFFQSWQHSTIARRVAFLRGMSRDPHAEPRFQRWLAGTKWGLMVGLMATMAVLMMWHGWESKS